MITKAIRFDEFVGRDTELGFLGERLREAARGTGSMAIIVGDAGLGKTRLIQEFRKAVAGVTQTSAIGTCLEYVHSTLRPFVEILNATGTASSIRRLAGQQGNTIGPLDQTVRVFDAILERLSLFAKREPPALIVIEDLHWADDATLQMLEHLTRAVSSLPLCVIATCRTDAVRDDRRIGRVLSRLLRCGAHAVYLEPLTRGEVRFLMKSVFRQSLDLPRETTERVEDLAAGNPLYLEELLGEAIDRAQSGMRITERIPDTLKATILDRLDRLPPGVQEVIIAAAVLVDEFDIALLATVAHVDRLSAVGAIQHAVSANLMLQTPYTDRYRFRHVLIREVLYSQLTNGSAAVLHSRAAHALEGKSAGPELLAELAYHWSAAANLPMAIRYNEAAGNAAMAVYMYRDAARFFRRALELAPCHLERIRLEEQFANALFYDGSLNDAKSHFKNAIDGYLATKSLQDATRVIGMLYSTYDLDRDTEGGLAFAKSALGFVPKAGDSAFRDAVAIRTAAFLTTVDMSDEADALLKGVDAAQDGDTGSRVGLHDLRAITLARRGDFLEAIREFGVALDMSRICQAPRMMVSVAANLSLCYQLTGNLDEAERLARFAFDQSEVHHLGPTFESINELAYANVVFLRGRLLESIEILGRVFSRGTAFGEMRLQAALTAIPVALATMRHELLARCSDDSLIELAFTTKRADDIAALADAFAKLYVQQGRMEDAAALLHRAMIAAIKSPFALDLLITVAKYGLSTDVAVARNGLAELCSRRPEIVRRAYVAYFEAIAPGHERNWVDRKCFAKTASFGFEELGLPLQQADALEISGQQREALALYRKVPRRALKIAHLGALQNRTPSGGHFKIAHLM